MSSPVAIKTLVPLAALMLTAAWSSAYGALITEISLDDFDDPQVLDFETAPLGSISGTDSLFTSFGISQITAEADTFVDHFNSRPNSSRALWFDANGLRIVQPLPQDQNLADAGIQYTFELTELQTLFGFGMHDQSAVDLPVSFFDDFLLIGSIALNRPLGADLHQFYLESSEPFNRVIVGALPTGSDSGYAVDNITLDNTVPAVPEPSTLALFLTGLAGLGFMMRRRRSMQMKAA